LSDTLLSSELHAIPEVALVEELAEDDIGKGKAD
jgi:hypothetical protein